MGSTLNFLMAISMQNDEIKVQAVGKKTTSYIKVSLRWQL